MQRYNLNLRGGTYNQGLCYRMLPIYRQQVVPGQTVNIDAQVSLKTAALDQNVTTPCLMSVWFFYVPHRLVWDGWTQFISKTDGAPAFPETATAAPGYFDKATNAADRFSPLYRRAVKLCYNEYFGTESIGSAWSAWYDDITDDTVTGFNALRTPDQLLSKLTQTGTVDDPEFNVVASTIPLNEFYRQLMNARSQQRSQMTGDKYVDTLARMGVDATWMISERPEFLGTKSKMVSPSLTSNTTSVDSAFETARFQCGMNLNITGKQFAEHGYIVGIAGARPIYFQSDRSASDSSVTGEWIDSFYSADNLQTKDTFVANTLGIASGQMYAQRFGYLRNGTWINGYPDNTTDPTFMMNFQKGSVPINNPAHVVYPPQEAVPVSTELGTNQLAATCSVNLTGKTPVPLRVA